MVGAKNRDHHRDYSFRVVEITSAHKIQSNARFTPTPVPAPLVWRNALLEAAEEAE